jgi:hypothetical protein
MMMATAAVTTPDAVTTLKSQKTFLKTAQNELFSSDAFLTSYQSHQPTPFSPHTTMDQSHQSHCRSLKHAIIAAAQRSSYCNCEVMRHASINH